jgi:UDP-N-acetylglucosamine transferase subunit ALG13
MVRRSGKIPIVVPRRKYAQEHIDDHQFWYAERLAQGGEVIVVDDLSDLPSVVIRWREIAAQLPPPAGIDPAEAVRRFRNFVNELLP